MASKHTELSSVLRHTSKREALKLVLFDLDGTLSTGGMFTESLDRALEETLNQGITRDSLEERVRTGSTARNSLKKIVEAAGVSKERQEEVVDNIFASATRYFELALSKSPLVALEGVAELLEQLNKREDTMIGVVTNNISDVMKLKLSNSGLLSHFSIQNFMTSAENGGNKSELLEFAINNAEKELKTRFDRKDIFYLWTFKTP